MDIYTFEEHKRVLPTPLAVIALLKPITWFPPMWAFACGAISVGAVSIERWPHIVAGIILAGPLVCGTSQAINDWFDRHVDAINEPDRVIPSGKVPGRWGLWIACLGTALSALVAMGLGTVVFLATVLALVFAWAYSAPPARLKLNGWLGNGAVGFSYETLPWITAGAAALGTLPPSPILYIAILYGIGAHGILTLNDFKAVKGDEELGIRTLPVQLGSKPAALVACIIMTSAQLGVIGLLISLNTLIAPIIVSLLLVAQLLAMPHLIANPTRNAVWYSAIGVGLYVSGMMVTAIALASLELGGLQ